MVSKDQWFTDEKAPSAFDSLSKKGMFPGGFNGYQAAKALDVSPSPTFYKKFYAWEKAALEKSQQDDLPTSSGFPKTMTAMIDAFQKEAEKSWSDERSQLAQSITEAADERVSAARKREHLKREDNAHLVQLARDFENERDEALDKNAELQSLLDDSETQNAVLTARLAEREASFEKMLATFKAAASNDTRTGSPKTSPMHGDPILASNEKVAPDGSPKTRTQPSVDALDPTAARETADPNSPADNRPSASEPDRPEGGQSKLPPVNGNPKPTAEDFR